MTNNNDSVGPTPSKTLLVRVLTHPRPHPSDVSFCVPFDEIVQPGRPESFRSAWKVNSLLKTLESVLQAHQSSYGFSADALASFVDSLATTNRFKKRTVLTTPDFPKNLGPKGTRGPNIMTRLQQLFHPEFGPPCPVVNLRLEFADPAALHDYRALLGCDSAKQAPASSPDPDDAPDSPSVVSALDSGDEDLKPTPKTKKQKKKTRLFVDSDDGSSAAPSLKRTASDDLAARIDERLDACLDTRDTHLARGPSCRGDCS